MVKKKCIGCRELLDIKDKNNRCEKCRKKNDKSYNKNVRWNVDNKKFAEFYASSAWRKLRNLKFQLNPVCELCLLEGRVRVTEIIHHKVEVRVDWSKRLDLDNLCSVCKMCHGKIEHKKEKED